MPITDHQREARKKYIGSSDSAAICGVSPFSNPGRVYLEKTADLEEADETEAMERGNYVEPSILTWFADKFGKRILRNQYRVGDNGIQCANLDALVLEDELMAMGGKHATVKESPVAVVEAKSGSDKDGWWGAVPDGIPDHVRVQAQHQLIVTDLQLAYIPALIVEFGRPVFRLYEHPWDKDLADAIMSAEFNFWKNHVKAGVPPPDAPPLDVLKRIKRIPNKSVLVADELVVEWRLRETELSTAKKIAEDAKAAVIAALGDAEEGRSNKGTLTFMEQNRKGYEVKPSTFRVLKFKEKA